MTWTDGPWSRGPGRRPLPMTTSDDLAGCAGAGKKRVGSEENGRGFKTPGRSASQGSREMSSKLAITRRLGTVIVVSTSDADPAFSSPRLVNQSSFRRSFPFAFLI